MSGKVLRFGWVEEEKKMFAAGGLGNGFVIILRASHLTGKCVRTVSELRCLVK